MCSAAVKIALIERLADAGVTAIEAGSFVSPKWVPQMADTAAVLAGLHRKPGVSYSGARAQHEGLRRRRARRMSMKSRSLPRQRKVSPAATLNCGIAESIERFAPVTEAARRDGVKVRGYVSCVIDCPYEGPVAPAAVADVASRLLALGCYEVSLGDTVGTGTAGRVEAMIDAVAARVPVARLAAHFHDTYGQAVANILAALGKGVAVVDSSVAGLGGCPYAPGAAGNVASEDVVYLHERARHPHRHRSRQARGGRALHLARTRARAGLESGARSFG